MEYFTIELCETLLDLTALFVCIFIVLFIIISTFKNKRKISGIEKQEQTEQQTDNFNEAIMAQLIKQQFDKSLADVVGAINDEKLSNTKVDQEPEEIVQVEVVKEEVINKEIIKEAIIKEPEFIEADEHNQVKSEKIEEIDKYDEAVDLAKSGMDVYAIADKVKLPMGEIEVIVNLNKLRNEVRAA